MKKYRIRAIFPDRTNILVKEEAMSEADVIMLAEGFLQTSRAQKTRAMYDDGTIFCEFKRK